MCPSRGGRANCNSLRSAVSHCVPHIDRGPARVFVLQQGSLFHLDGDGEYLSTYAKDAASMMPVAKAREINSASSRKSVRISSLKWRFVRAQRDLRGTTKSDSVACCMLKDRGRK
jgi:hypothetical protein